MQPDPPILDVLQSCDIWLEILQYLKWHELLHIGYVCKFLFTLHKSNKLWQALFRICFPSKQMLQNNTQDGSAMRCFCSTACTFVKIKHDEVSSLQLLVEENVLLVVEFAILAELSPHRLEMFIGIEAVAHAHRYYGLWNNGTCVGSEGSTNLDFTLGGIVKMVVRKKGATWFVNDKQVLSVSYIQPILLRIETISFLKQSDKKVYSFKYVIEQ